MTEEKFTPTQELVLEVLVARYRLGEPCWTFTSRVMHAVESLENRGFVTWKSASVENAILVWPTDRLLGDNQWMVSSYRPPAIQSLRSAIAMFLRVRGTFCAACIDPRDGTHYEPCEGSAVQKLNDALRGTM